jgi:hypothetical protein
MELKRAISIEQLLKKRFKTITLTGKWKESFGEIVERNGSWIIYGDSGQGKTTFALQILQMLTNYGRCAYDTIEEGARLTFQESIKRQRFSDRERKHVIILSEGIPALIERLAKPKSPDFIIIDSIQFAYITKREYSDLIEMFPTKTFIWLSHADGKRPKGSLAEHVEYHADIKMYVQGFKVFVKTRYGGGEDYTIDAEKAAQYWNDII